MDIALRDIVQVIVGIITGGITVFATLRKQLEKKISKTFCAQCKQNVEDRFTTGDRRMDGLQKSINTIDTRTQDIASNVSYIRGRIDEQNKKGGE